MYHTLTISKTLFRTFFKLFSSGFVSMPEIQPPRILPMARRLRLYLPVDSLPFQRHLRAGDTTSEVLSVWPPFQRAPAPVHYADVPSAPLTPRLTSCGPTTTDHFFARHERHPLRNVPPSFAPKCRRPLCHRRVGQIYDLARTPFRNPNQFYSSNTKRTKNKRERINFIGSPSDTSTTS